MRDGAIILVCGSGDIGSAIACRLFQQGCKVVIHESSQPTATRRGMAYTNTVFGGSAVLDGVPSVLVEDIGQLSEILSHHETIPVITGSFALAHSAANPAILVDARMRKRQVPEDMRPLASLTIGLGPNFVAGGNCHVAVETSWEDLGSVILQGPTLPFRGEPREVGGRQRERYLYAPSAGRFRTSNDIGDHVTEGQIIAMIEDTPLQAPLSGVIRGLTHDGVDVSEGTKVIEVDPRGPDQAVTSGIAERPERIAGGVLEAVARWSEARQPGD